MRKTRICGRLLFCVAAIVIPYALYETGYKYGYTGCWSVPLQRKVCHITWRAEDAVTGQQLHATLNWGALYDKGSFSGYDIPHTNGTTTSVLLTEKRGNEIPASITAENYRSESVVAKAVDSHEPSEPVVVKLSVHP